MPEMSIDEAESAPDLAPHSGSSPPPPVTPPAGDPLTEMTPRFNLFFRWFARRFFGHFSLDESDVARLRELEGRGSVIYVMRYSSRLDYFLFNALFLREKLRLSGFANGIRFYYYRPLHRALRTALWRKRGRPREIEQSEAADQATRIARSGGSLFLFLRVARFRSFMRGRRRRPQHTELDLLTRVIESIWDSETPVSIVPLSVFWRKGPRSESRFLNLSYGSLTRPSDVLKVSSFLATYRDLTVKCGEPIDVSAFVSDHREEGPIQVARKIRRSILTYLYREEKVVQGPTLRTRQRVREEVLSVPAVRAAIAQRAKERRGGAERANIQAERIFNEIAANQNSTFLAGLAVAVGWIFRRMFVSIEVDGLEKVAEYAKRHPIVLVPSHRSYFDFLIISWLFYKNYMVPPHIAARDNMAFGPFGFIFRRAGAFFLRRSFDDPLYKEVFRSYVAYLVREGFPQEFFIEGGRSRTGKTLAPRLGMLAWDVEAFLASSRRELFLVPIAITYERLVEESAMVDELQGGEKTKESVIGLVRARKYLQRRFGSVHVEFGEPISLAAALGDRREALSRIGDEVADTERRHFIESLGLRIVESINWSAVANATSVAGCVVMGVPHQGLLRRTFVERMRQIVDLLQLQGVKLTPALLSDRADFRESIAFLQRSDLLKSVGSGEDEILFFEETHRRALDMYRNGIAQFLAAPSVLARRLSTGATAKELEEDLVAWREILYQEYFSPGSDVLEEQGNKILTHFAERRWITQTADRCVATESGRPVLRFLAEQTRGVIEAYHAACEVAGDPDLLADRGEFMRRAADRLEHARLLGRARRPEAANDTTFQNAVDLMLRRGILERREVERKPEKRGRRARVATCFAPGERADALGELRDRLAGVLEGADGADE
jgi:glycerol-3-phosphate O-acyltransferase